MFIKLPALYDVLLGNYAHACTAVRPCAVACTVALYSSETVRGKAARVELVVPRCAQHPWEGRGLAAGPSQGLHRVSKTVCLSIWWGYNLSHQYRNCFLRFSRFLLAFRDSVAGSGTEDKASGRGWWMLHAGHHALVG